MQPNKKNVTRFGLVSIGVARCHRYPNRPQNNFSCPFLGCVLVLYSVKYFVFLHYFSYLYSGCIREDTL